MSNSYVPLAVVAVWLIVMTVLLNYSIIGGLLFAAVTGVLVWTSPTTKTQDEFTGDSND